MSQLAYLIIGAKGGVGATTVALELVARLPPGRPRAIVDADLIGRRAHAVWFDAAAQLDDGRERAAPAVTTVRDTFFMELTRTYEDGFSVSEADVEQMRSALPYDTCFIVDAPQPFASAVRPFAARAAAFVVVTEPTLFGTAAARSMMLALGRFGVGRERIVVVLNNARGVQELQRGEIGAALGQPVLCEIPQRRHRTFGKVLDQLSRTLGEMQAAPAASGLAPSASIGIADRRTGSRGSAEVAIASAPRVERVADHSADIERFKAELHEGLMSRVDFLAAARAHTDAAKMAELRAQVDEIAGAMLAERGGAGGAEATARIRREIVEEAVGFGAIESLLRDDDVTEVMVNGYKNIYVERRGRIERTAKRFADDRQLRLVIERMIGPLGRRIDESSPMVDARLPDGSRVNAIIEPLSIDGPTLTIRRFGSRRLSMDDLVGLGSLTAPYADFLRAVVEARLNVMVSGGTGSGKTTLLNAVSAFIPRSERIVTIEDAAELLLDQPHVVRLEARPPNLEGAGAVAIRDLLRNALRMRPDRIIVGECRGGEALDMLQAMNTGHDGSLTTVHANSPRDAMSRIETMVLMAGFDLPMRAIREQIASAMDIVVHVDRLSDGSRRLVSITEVVGMEGDIVTMQEIARFRQRGKDAKGVVQGAFEITGVQPHCLTKFDEMGIEFDISELGKRHEEAPLWALR